MLDPQDRQLYLDALKPPPGYRLDKAVATTYSLDLVCALMAPVAMAAVACNSVDDADQDWLAVLDSLRRTADHWTVFCQQGQIAVPRQDSPLFRSLEQAVVEVAAPGGGVFHPKLWLLRFTPTNPESDPRYRLLCLSRNLTWDRSWDTILVIEGTTISSGKDRDRNRPLADFLRSLPALSVRPLSEDQLAVIDRLAGEVKRVYFHAPDGFRPVRGFFPMGVFDEVDAPKLHDPSRVLVISPFLSDEMVCQLLSPGDNNVLVSNEDSFDTLSDETYEQLRQNTALFHWADSALTEDETASQLRDAAEPEVGQPLLGLHAKLYVAEHGNDVRLLTGSANATDAAWRGHNVEFMVELRGGREEAGIDKLLGPEVDDNEGAHTSEEPSLRDLLVPYDRPDQIGPVDTAARQIADDLRNAKRAILASDCQVTVSGGQDAYDLQIDARCGSGLALPAEVQLKCWPASLKENVAKDAGPLLKGEPVSFAPLTMMALTSFVAFELSAGHGKQRQTLRFLLNLPAHGMPVERATMILGHIIKEYGGFLRYLRLLLADEDDRYRAVGPSSSTTSGVYPGISQELPLFEEMVTALSRHPDKIEDIDALVQELTSTDGNEGLLPEGFRELWQVFMVAKEAGTTK